MDDGGGCERERFVDDGGIGGGSGGMESAESFRPSSVGKTSSSRSSSYEGEGLSSSEGEGSSSGGEEGLAGL